MTSPGKWITRLRALLISVTGHYTRYRYLSVWQLPLGHQAITKGNNGNSIKGSCCTALIKDSQSLRVYDCPPSQSNVNVCRSEGSFVVLRFCYNVEDFTLDGCRAPSLNMNGACGWAHVCPHKGQKQRTGHTWKRQRFQWSLGLGRRVGKRVKRS